MPRKATESTAYSAVGATHHAWEPRLSRLPWKGLCALILAVAGVVVAVAILAVSNGDEVKHWRFQPTVYLAIASTVTNITVTYALFEGVSISWWSKALKDGTTAADLQPDMGLWHQLHISPPLRPPCEPDRSGESFGGPESNQWPTSATSDYTRPSQCQHNAGPTGRCC